MEAITSLRELRTKPEGELRALYKQILDAEVQIDKGERLTESWLDLREYKTLLEAEFRARALEPRVGLKVKLKSPKESNGNTLTLTPVSLNARIGELPKEELQSLIENAKKELERRGEGN